jgi:hypothetical protein
MVMIKGQRRIFDICQVQAASVQAYYKPIEFQEVDAPRFEENLPLKVVRSVVHISRLQPQGKISLFVSSFRNCFLHNPFPFRFESRIKLLKPAGNYAHHLL